MFVRNINYNQWFTAIFYQETLEKTIFYGSVALAEEPIIDKVYKLGRKVGDRFKESMRVLFDDYLGKPTDFQGCTSESRSTFLMNSKCQHIPHRFRSSY